MDEYQNTFLNLRRAELEGELLGMLMAIDNWIEDAYLSTARAREAMLELRDLLGVIPTDY